MLVCTLALARSLGQAGTYGWLRKPRGSRESTFTSTPSFSLPVRWFGDVDDGRGRKEGGKGRRGRRR
eukprot:3288217-Prorocentrum_lima.AAC.1